MILVEPVQNGAATFADAVTLAGQVVALGHKVVIRAERLPEGLHTRDKYEALSLLREKEFGPVSAMLVIGGQSADDIGLQSLRRVALRDDAPVIVFGQFNDRQANLAAMAKIAYVTGREPTCVDLTGRPDLAVEGQACPSFGVVAPMTKRPFLQDLPPVLVWLADTDASVRRPWDGLFHSRLITPVVLTPARNKEDWLHPGAVGRQIYHLGEMSPSDMSRFSNILVIASNIGTESRVLCLINNVTVSGGIVIDATESGSLSRLDLPVIRGPADPGFLHDFLRDAVLPNLTGLQAELAASPFRQRVDLAQFLAENGVSAPGQTVVSPRKVDRKRSRSVLFLPTNGIGMGHARRCSLLATAMLGSGIRSTFAAFASCGPMIATGGFDWAPLVAKSRLHEQENAYDIVNSGRLNGLLAGCDVFVFDGASVYDSVVRSILRSGVPAVWVRRGLWPTMQDNSVALDRSKVFARIIIPGEAFAELNFRYSDGPRHFPVGPVVQRVGDNTAAVRKALVERLGIKFGQLVVTMLGGGVATDMSAQVQTVCAAVEQRRGVLHLILVWPGSVVPPVWHMWQRSRVVMTSHASVLAAASDFIISAAGYNSFHEAMYNRIPAIFVPQDAPYLDNQSARAEAAATRAVAVHVEAGRLGALDREISRFLDHGKAAEIKARLSALDLPPPGNRDAAARILELLP